MCNPPRAAHTPVVYDNLQMGHAWALKWGWLEQVDLNGAAALTDAMPRSASRRKPTLQVRTMIQGGEN
jgi:hypothetical protein